MSVADFTIAKCQSLSEPTAEETIPIFRSCLFALGTVPLSKCFVQSVRSRRGSPNIKVMTR
jgi:hypothetical protein